MDVGVGVLAEAVDRLVDAPVWALSDTELAAAVESVHREQQRLAAVQLALVRDLDGRGLGVRQGASSTAVWLRGRLNVTVAAAQRLLRLAAAVDAAPAVVGEALACARIGVEQAQVVVGAVAGLPAAAGRGRGQGRRGARGGGRIV